MNLERPSRETLIRYFRGQSLPQEEKLVDIYLSMDTDRDYVEACLMEAWNNLEDDTQPLPDEKQQAVWNEFQQRKLHVAQFPPRNRMRWLAYAASILLLVGATFAVIRFDGSKSAPQNFTHYAAELGKRRDIKLADNSRITLFPGSSVDIPQNFNDKDRKIILKGRAFFEVAHNKQKPFWVKAGRLVTKDIGTSFGIQEAGNTNVVILKTGSVSIDADNKELAKLVPGQQLTYQTAAHQFKIAQVDVNQSLSWVNGELVYDLTPLSTICHDLEKWYNVKITIKDPELKNKKITTSFKDMPVKDAIDVLALTGGLTYTIQGDQVTIK